MGGRKGYCASADLARVNVRQNRTFRQGAEAAALPTAGAGAQACEGDRLGLDEEGHRTVVDQFHLHAGCKLAGGDGCAELAEAELKGETVSDTE